MALSFQRKYAVAVIVASLSFAALLGLGIDSIVRLSAVAAAAEHAHGLQHRLDNVLMAMLDLESRQRAYLLTMDSAHFEAYGDASRQLDEHLAQLSAALSVHPEQVGEHARLASLVEQRRTLLDGQIRVARAQGAKTAMELLPIGSGSPLRDRIREVMMQMREEESRAFDAQEEQTAVSLRRAIWLGGAMAALSALLLMASHLLIRREHAAQARALRFETAAREAAQQEAQREAHTLEITAAALDDSQARLRGTFESATDAILVADETQTIVMANPASATMFRCTMQDVVGAPLERFIPERFRQRHRRDVQAFGATETGARRMGRQPDVWGLRRDGEEFPLDASISPLQVGDRPQYMVVLRDVTELRQAQRELARSHDELRRLVAAQEEVRERERKRIAREIHDDLQQTLAAIKIDLGAAAARLRSDPASVETMLEGVDRLATEAVTATRRIINDLRPRVLDDLGLVPALEVLVRQFGQRHGIDCVLAAADGDGAEVQVSQRVATCLYRVTQEALQNVAKHAGARRVQVGLSQAGAGWLRLRVEDDGDGLDDHDLHKPQSFGLLGMRERVWALGGRVEIKTGTTGGTVVQVELPITAKQESTEQD